MERNGKRRSALILLVEADPFLKQSLQDIFDLSGYQVITASNGTEGLDILRKLPILPDVIVTDVQRSDMDGCQFFTAVRTEWQRQAIPFVFLSTHFKGNPPCADTEGEAVEIVTKPFPVVQLLEAIAKATSQAQVG